MARRPNKNKGYPVDGVLLLDKDESMTSNQALQQVKSLLFARKAGHTGSLDPIATGLIPICFGPSTKISSFFLKSDKYYQVKLKLGQTTTTGDREGEILKSCEINFTDTALNHALTQFKGEIEQIPPMYSAIKYQGQPLYKLARKGIEIERKARRVTIHALNLIGRGEDWMILEMHVSSGFYVRSLATDLGHILGCGAHVEQLRRTQVGHLSITDAWTLSAIESYKTPKQRALLLIPTDQALSHLAAVHLSDNVARYLCRGQSVRTSDKPASGIVRIYSPSVGFLGLGEVTEEGKIAPKKLFTTL